MKHDPVINEDLQKIDTILFLITSKEKHNHVKCAIIVKAKKSIHTFYRIFIITLFTSIDTFCRYFLKLLRFVFQNYIPNYKQKSYNPKSKANSKFLLLHITGHAI